MKVYQIKNWGKTFENYKSREREQCGFVCVPNKQHGMGLATILSKPNGAAIYGIWCLMIGAASRQKKPRNGWLTNDGYQTGTPWVPSSMAVLWRRTTQEIEEAIEVLSSPEVGWLEIHDHPSSLINKGTQTDTRLVPAQYPPGTLEEKRIEEKNTPVKSADANFRGGEQEAERQPEASEESTMNQFDSCRPEASPEAKLADHPPSPPAQRPVKQKKTRKTTIEHSESGMKFACWFRDLLDESNRPDDRMLPKWAKCYDDLLRIDGRSREEVAAVCKWARADHFWSRNFLSPLKLRKKNDEDVPYFNVLKTQMEAAKRQEIAPTVTPQKKDNVMHWTQHL